MKKSDKIKKTKFESQKLSKTIGKKPSKTKFILTAVVLILGLALMPTGFILSNVVQERIDEGIAEQVEVPHPHNSKFEEWGSNDYEDAPEIYTKYYVWNLTNPEGFLAGDKPIYEEIGPFVFREFKYKYDVKFSNDKDEVTFKEYSNYVQVGGENISKVMITNINPGFLGGVATAGGTELQYNQLNFPFVLSQVKEQFNTIFTTTVNEKLDDDIFIHDSVEEMMQDCTALIGTVHDTFIDCVGYDAIKEFMREGLPTAEEVFFEEWANDYFPPFHGDYTILHDAAQASSHIFKDLVTEIIDDEDCQNAQDTIITMQNARLVNEAGSIHGKGVDIDGPYGYLDGSEADLNITIAKAEEIDRIEKDFYILLIIWATTMDLPVYGRSGGSGLTNDQYIALWNKSNPYSLTGMDFEANKIWFDAANGNIDSKNFLKTKFGIDNTQLNYILKWINVSTTTWEPNAIEYTINGWNAGVVTTRTVEEWLYTANDTAISNYMAYYGKDPNRSKVNIFDDCQNTLEAEEAEIPSCKIKTGRNDVSEIGQYVEYEGQDTIYLWKDPEDVEGTNGMQFAPGVTKETKLKTFQPDLMRVAELEYDDDAEIYDIDLLRFKMADDTFAVNPNYYMNTLGLINLKPIDKYQGIDIRVSKPHFLGADPKVQYGIIGAKPDGDVHDTYIDVEPNTGIVMNAKKCIQINIELKQTEYFLTNISNVVTPIVWMEQSGEIPEELAEDFKDMLYSALELKEQIPLWCIGLGMCIAVTSSASSIHQVKKRKNFNKRKNLTEQKVLKTKLGDLKQKLGMVPQDLKNIEINKPNPDKPLGFNNSEVLKSDEYE